MKPFIQSIANEISKITTKSGIRSITQPYQIYKEKFLKNFEAKSLFDVKKVADIPEKYPNLKPSVDEDFQKYAKNIEKKLYREISLIIENNISKLYQAVITDKIISNVYVEVTKEVEKIIEEPYIKEEIEEVLLEIGEDSSITSKFFQEIKSNLLYNILQATIPKHLKMEAPRCIFNEKDPNGKTLLDIACEAGNADLVKYLTKEGWGKNAIPSLIEIANKKLSEIKVEKENFKITWADRLKLNELEMKEKELNEIIHYLKTPDIVQKNARGTMGMIGLMGAATSPAKKVAVFEEAELGIGIYPEKLDVKPAKIKDMQSGIATTPSGSLVYPTWDIIVDKDRGVKNGTKAITIFLDEKKAEKNIEKVKNKKEKPPSSLPKNNKIEKILITSGPITKNRLMEWDNRKKQGGRYRSQIKTMGNHSASNVAKYAGFHANKSQSWQWCHLIAFSMGGEDGKFPESEHKFDIEGPQRESNMVVGTVEANAHMLIVEDLVKDLILRKGVEPLYIMAKPIFVKGLEEYHIAETVEYTIQDDAIHPKYQITFTFDMLDRRKTAFQEPEVIRPILEELFLHKGDSIFPELSRDWRSFPSPSIFASPFRNKSENEQKNPTLLNLSSESEEQGELNESFETLFQNTLALKDETPEGFWKRAPISVRSSPFASKLQSFSPYKSPIKFDFDEKEKSEQKAADLLEEKAQLIEKTNEIISMIDSLEIRIVKMGEEKQKGENIQELKLKLQNLQLEKEEISERRKKIEEELDLKMSKSNYSSMMPIINFDEKEKNVKKQEKPG